MSVPKRKRPVRVTVYEKHTYRFADTTTQCVAHGYALCVACARTSGDTCQCGAHATTGMHWDTCPQRIANESAVRSVSVSAGRLSERTQR